jgi:hypothetical protein
LLLLLRFPYLLLPINSSVAELAVSMAVGISALIISIAISIVIGMSV